MLRLEALPGVKWRTRYLGEGVLQQFSSQHLGSKSQTGERFAKSLSKRLVLHMNLREIKRRVRGHVESKERYMKYVKMLGLFVLAATALMAFAANASATTLTSPPGTTYTGTIVAESEGETTLENSSIGLKVQCEESKVEGSVKQHGTGVTAKGTLVLLTFVKCTGGYTVTTIQVGELEIHNISGTGDGTLTSTGTQITIHTPLGFSCTYTTSGTDIGRLTGKDTQHATLDIGSSVIPRTADSSLCGTSATWTGSYTVVTPSNLTVDA
ncbi:MAG: hypothetical protein ACTHN3_02905 [Solirubrobacterales bacterium]